MKKPLNVTSIANELDQGSVFFREKSKQPSPPHPAPAPNEPILAPQKKPAKPRTPAITNNDQQSQNISSMHASNHASMLANHPDALIETVRKTVKQIGKETTFLRLTPEEKEQLREIDYTYKRRGIKTSENEISRIGLKFLLEDYKAHGEASILARVLAALNA